MRIESRVQRIHEKREERVDVGRGFQVEAPANLRLVNRVLDVGVEGVAEPSDVPAIRASLPTAQCVARRRRESTRSSNC